MTEHPFRFEDPPPPKRAPHGFAETARKLRENPGQWALVAAFDKRTNCGSLSRQIRAGLTSYWRPAGDFEATGRAIDGEYRVYARFLGDGGHSDE